MDVHRQHPEGGGGAFDVGYLVGSRLDMRTTIDAPPYPNPSNGGFCADTDPAATWAYQAASRTVLLRPHGTDPCGDRTAILAGTWARE